MESNSSQYISKDFLKDIEDFYILHNNFYQKLAGYNLNTSNKILNAIAEEFQNPFFNSLERLGNHYQGLNQSSKTELEMIIRNNSYYKILQEAPYLWQTITKPNGYAGDFMTMEIIYENAFKGSSIFGKVYNKVTTSCNSCEGVRHRRTFLKKFILETLNGSCLAVAAGSGREIADAYSEGFNGVVTAIDTDIDALRYFKDKNKILSKVEYRVVNVFELLKNNFKTLTPKQFYLQKANPKKDIKGYMKYLMPFLYNIGTLKNKKFDLIYSAGLFDYIKTFPDNNNKGTIGLSKVLFNLLNPGGKLIIGIMSTNMPIGELFYMEVLCDWKIIFRSRDQLLEFAGAIKKEEIENIEIQDGYEGIQAYLIIQKKQ